MREGVALERKVFYPLFNTSGFKEGVNAFVSKKTPNHYDLWSINIQLNRIISTIKNHLTSISSL